MDLNRTETLRRELHDLKARQTAGERHSCPRCGQDIMNEQPVRNALSRGADVYVCDACGMEEALLAMMQSPLPLEQWRYFNED